MRLADTGLPAALHRVGSAVSLLAGSMSMVAGARSCAPISWGHCTAEVTRWKGACRYDDGLLQEVEGSIEADGTMLYTVTMSPASGSDPAAEVQLVVPFNESQVPYCMGLGRPGGLRKPQAWRWWSGQIQGVTGYENNLVWCGDVNHGMRLKLVGEGDQWLGALHQVTAVPSWGGEALPNDSAPVGSFGLMCAPPNCTLYSGGANISEADGGVAKVIAYTGVRLEKAASFRFELLLTPSVRLNTTAHFGDQGRYYQYSMPSPAGALNASWFLQHGVKVVNVHQGVPVLNPFINYPFEPAATNPLSKMADEMHAGGGRLKLYYTTRELSDHAAELWLLKALGEEVLDAGGAMAAYRNTAGQSGGASWLQEHLDSHYSVCWSTPSANLDQDSSLISCCV